MPRDYTAISKHIELERCDQSKIEEKCSQIHILQEKSKAHLIWLDAQKVSSKFGLNKAGYTAQDAPSMRSFHLRK